MIQSPWVCSVYHVPVVVTLLSVVEDVNDGAVSRAVNPEDDFIFTLDVRVVHECLHGTGAVASNVEAYVTRVVPNAAMNGE
jgi:hypothetical protein